MKQIHSTPRTFRFVVACLLLWALTSTTPAAAWVAYDRYKLFELAPCADFVVAGEITAVHADTFDLRVDQHIVGVLAKPVITVRRFVDWTCAGRWTDYCEGQRIVAFLHAPGKERGTRGVFAILGGGGEGEMPLVDDDVIVRGYRMHYHPPRKHDVEDEEVWGSRVPLSEFVSAIQGQRLAFAWTEHSNYPQVETICTREGGLAVETFASSSDAARHLAEQVLSADEWTGGPEPAPPPARFSPRKIVAFDHGFAGPTRLPKDYVRGRFDGEPWCGFGSAKTFLGDLDGDGIGDLAVGARLDRLYGKSHGAVWILFLAEDGSVRSHAEISEGKGGGPLALNEHANWGEALCPLGDLNGDGTPDLAVGAPGFNGKTEHSGGLWCLFLAPDGSVREAVKLGAQGILADEMIEEDYGLGKSLATLGDLDGDGTLEIAVGQSASWGWEYGRGRSVLILSLATDGSVVRYRELHDLRDGFCERTSWFGDSIACVGDLDGNGVPDLAISNHYDDDGGRGRGAVWIVFLRANGTLLGKQKISDWSGGFEPVLRDRHGFGRNLAAPGDLDGDGVPDLLVEGGTGLWVLFLQRDGTVARFHDLQQVAVSFGEEVYCGGSLAVAETRNAEGRTRFVWGGGPIDGPVGGVLWMLSIGEDGQIDAW